MPRPRPDQYLRHEPPSETEDEEDGFVVRKPTQQGLIRESGYVAVVPKPVTGKGKRSLEDMMASQPNALSQSIYALQRIAALEDQIVKILALCTPEARKYVLKQRETLARYAPDDE